MHKPRRKRAKADRIVRYPGRGPLCCGSQAQGGLWSQNAGPRIEKRPSTPRRRSRSRSAYARPGGICAACGFRVPRTSLTLAISDSESSSAFQKSRRVQWQSRLGVARERRFVRLPSKHNDFISAHRPCAALTRHVGSSRRRESTWLSGTSRLIWTCQQPTKGARGSRT